MADRVDKCPKCGGPLRAQYRELRTYPVNGVTPNNVDCDYDRGEIDDTTLVRVFCDYCLSDWDSEAALLVEAV